MSQEEKPSFKVVDRRAAHGAEEQKTPEKKPVEEPKAEQPKTLPTINFTMFIQSLAHQAMLGLGLAPWPDSNEAKIELGFAKEMIDILGMLQKKTANNLDKDEQALLDTLVYQLQVAFTEIKKTSDSVLIK